MSVHHLHAGSYLSLHQPAPSKKAVLAFIAASSRQPTAPDSPIGASSRS